MISATDNRHALSIRDLINQAQVNTPPTSATSAAQALVVNLAPNPEETFISNIIQNKSLMQAINELDALLIELQTLLKINDDTNSISNLETQLRLLIQHSDKLSINQKLKSELQEFTDYLSAIFNLETYVFNSSGLSQGLGSILRLTLLGRNIIEELSNHSYHSNLEKLVKQEKRKTETLAALKENPDAFWKQHGIDPEATQESSPSSTSTSEEEDLKPHQEISSGSLNYGIQGFDSDTEFVIAPLTTRKAEQNTGFGRIGTDFLDHTYFYYQLRYVSGMNGESKPLNLPKQPIQLNTQNSFEDDCIELPIDTSRISQFTPLPCVQGFSASGINIPPSAYKQAYRDSLGLVYLENLNIDQVPKNQNNQPCLIYKLSPFDPNINEIAKTIQANPLPIDLEDFAKDLPLFALLKSRFPKGNPDIEYEYIDFLSEFITKQAQYRNVPNLCRITRLGKNMLKTQLMLGFLGVCRDFAYCAELLLRYFDVNCFQAGVLVNSDGKFNNTTHAVNLIHKNNHPELLRSDFTPQEDEDLSPDLLEYLNQQYQDQATLLEAQSQVLQAHGLSIFDLPDIHERLVKMRRRSDYDQFSVYKEILYLNHLLRTPSPNQNLQRYSHLKDNSSPDLDSCNLISLELKTINLDLSLERQYRQLNTIEAKTSFIKNIITSQVLLEFSQFTEEEINEIASILKSLSNPSNIISLHRYLRGCLLERELSHENKHRKIKTESEIRSLLEKYSILHQALIPKAISSEAIVNKLCLHLIGFTNEDKVILELAQIFPSIDPDKIHSRHQKIIKALSESVSLAFDAQGDLLSPNAEAQWINSRLYPANQALTSLEAKIQSRITNPELLNKLQETQRNLRTKIQPIDLSSYAAHTGDEILLGLPIQFQDLHPDLPYLRCLDIFRTLPLVQSNPNFQQASKIFSRNAQLAEVYTRDLKYQLQSYCSNFTTLLTNLIKNCYGMMNAQNFIELSLKLSNSNPEDYEASLQDYQKSGQLHPDLILLLRTSIQYPEITEFLSRATPEKAYSSITKLKPSLPYYGYKSIPLNARSYGWEEIQDLASLLGNAKTLNETPLNLRKQKQRGDFRYTLGPQASPNPLTDIRDYAIGDDPRSINWTESFKADNRLRVNCSNPLWQKEQAQIHEYLLELSSLKDKNKLLSLLKELEEKSRSEDCRNPRGTSPIKIQVRIIDNGRIISTLNHKDLVQALSMQATPLDPEHGIRKEREVLIAELLTLAELSPQNYPKSLTSTLELSPEDFKQFTAETLATIKKSPTKIFLYSDDSNWVRAISEQIQTTFNLAISLLE